ncbi:NAD(P)-dependent oxidoreductase [Paracoccus suum]|uniref:NAD(P)-dependent oxidoreductase n=1 Tax=Paracoccus suum TaxID=2259340 RepID=A0A344PIP3_9RHOB|nr:NAD(P)-dependent oxidoreductase [Paracoccus suum]AXC49248.1 NAD(P)-dependent oxidoreductase [Paracoccus suum]
MAGQRMLKFVTLGREMPEKRPAGERAEDFNEIYREFAAQKAAEQASRCSQCGVPYCQSHCPLHNNIPDWLRLTAEGRLREAYQTAQATNTFPEICGRICPQDRLCEGNCVIEQSGHGTVTIGAVEKYITDTAWAEGWVEGPRPQAERGESVGIIGAGPGGLAAADMLRRVGFQVTVYDRHDRAGGLLTYGIPGFKLEKDVVTRRVALLAEAGVEFVLNTAVGEDLSFDAIRGRHDAVLIATGVYKTRDLDIDNAEARGVVRALDYLTAANRVEFGDEVPDFLDGELDARGKRVIVIGGGDTAMDCVRTAIRQGAQSVKCLYRRDRANMPGSQREVANAEEEGVEFVWMTAPGAFAGAADGGRPDGVTFAGHVTGEAATGDEAEVANAGGDVTGDGIGDNPVIARVRVQRMRLGVPDISGRQSPELIEGADYDEPAELVIKALGFEPEELPRLWGQPGLEVTRWGTIRAEHGTHRTSLPGVYAVGDIVRGASLVVWAIRDGREAAARIVLDLDSQLQQTAAE